MKATIKLYQSNATIFTDDNTMDISYDPDSIPLEYYETQDEYLEDVKNEIIEKLGNIDNIDDIMIKIEIQTNHLF